MPPLDANRLEKLAEALRVEEWVGINEHDPDDVKATIELGFDALGLGEQEILTAGCITAIPTGTTHILGLSPEEIAEEVERVLLKLRQNVWNTLFC